MALFKEGNPGGGRKLGSKNKIKRALEVFRQLEFNPLEEAIEVVGVFISEDERRKDTNDAGRICRQC